ncbi:MAG: HesA/MoeB/ThiF family protein [Deltaproteobacteria bacterium]
MVNEIFDWQNEGSNNSGSLPINRARELAVENSIPLPELEAQAMQQGIMPLRYQRNIGTITAKEQLVLAQSTAAIIGCGGLGGHVLEQLTRMGVGNILVWDYDVFEEHNLNRQLLSNIDSIGHSKVETAEVRVASLNPAVRFEAVFGKFDQEQGRAILGGCHIVVDALDNVQDRLQLSALCRELRIPLVHGAVEGWMGQLTTQFPEDRTIETVYARPQNTSEKWTISTPSFTPALVASLQSAEVIKVLLGRGEILRRKIMLVNLLDMDIDTIEIKDQGKDIERN